MFSLHQTSSTLSAAHTQTTILNHCLITLSNDLTERLQQKSQLQDRSFCFSNSNKTTPKSQPSKTTKSRRRSKKSFLLLLFSSKKQNAHTQTIQLSCSSQSQTSFSLSIISLKSFRRTQQLSMWINDGSLAKQSYARAFAWSNESTFQKRGYIQYIYIVVLFS